MLRIILRFRSVLILGAGLSLFCPAVFAQGHQDGYNGDKPGTINRDPGVQDTSNRHGSRHYYHNGHWNRNGWFGWGTPVPVFSNGVLIASLPPGYTTVVVGGNTYYYGNNTYFSQLPAGGYAVVTLPLSN